MEDLTPLESNHYPRGVTHTLKGGVIYSLEQWLLSSEYWLFSRDVKSSRVVVILHFFNSVLLKAIT